MLDDVCWMMDLESQTFAHAALFIGTISVFLIEERTGRNFQPVLELVPNWHYTVLIIGITSPNSHFVIFLTDLDPGAADLQKNFKKISNKIFKKL